MALRSLTFLSTAAALALAGCAAGPDYQRPELATPANFKTAPGWAQAQPADHIERGRWWELFNDPALNDLAERALAANQTIAQAAANYAQARAAVREARSELFPTVDLSGSARRSGTGGGNTIIDTGGGGTGTISSGGRSSSSYRLNIGASWEPDLFGRIGRTVENASASAEASLADLASARLAIEGELVTNYLGLRETDAEIGLVQSTVEGYQRALEIATNRYNAGVVARTDVFQAQSQLASTQSQLEGLRRDRATYENAIAVLVGEPASSFSVPAAEWTPNIPNVPVGLPSELLQRRPDIAAAERNVKAANASIGIQQSAFFPSITLSGEGGLSANSLGDLFTSSATLWSLGASLAETIFDAGARSARVAEARAAYDAAVAQYRELVLEAFQDVENQLTASQILARQQQYQRTAATAAAQTEASILNQYRSGLVTYTDVVSAQATSLSARRTLLLNSVDRQTAAVALIQAIGGGWEGLEAEAAAAEAVQP